MKTTVSAKGQIVLPAEFRQQDSIEPGQAFEIERVDRGEYRLVRREPRPNEGLVDWLLACPEKGFFVAIESADRTVSTTCSFLAAAGPAGWRARTARRPG